MQEALRKTGNDMADALYQESPVKAVTASEEKKKTRVQAFDLRTKQRCVSWATMVWAVGG